MEELTAIKRELKCWESMFERKHGRRPNKDDIKNASEEIRDTYIKYKHLKEAATKNKEVIEEDDDGVFGKKLNKKYEDKKPLVPIRLKGWENIKPVRLCHGQRPKPKATDKATAAKNDSENKAVESEKETCTDTFGIKPVTIANTIKTPTFKSKPSQIINRKTPGSADSRISRRASLYATSLKKIENEPLEENLPDSPQNKDFANTKERFIKSKRDGNHSESNDDDIMYGKKADEHIESVFSNAHTVCHKEKNNNNSCPKKDEEGIISNECEATSLNIIKKNDVSCDKDKSEEISTSTCNRNLTNVPVVTKKSNKMTIVQPSESFQTLHNENTVKHRSSSMTEVDQLKSSHNKEDLSIEFGFETTEVTKPKKLKTDAGQQLNKAVKHTSMKSPKVQGNNNEESVEGMTIDPMNDQVNVQVNKKKRKANDDIELKVFKKLKQNEADVQFGVDTVESCEDEGNHADDVPHDTFEETKIKSEKITSRPSSSGLVSDNFVRLDMKHKKYRRRGHGISGSAYKRRAYNNIMKARGEYVSKSSWSRRGASGRGRGGGSWGTSKGVSGTCFKCGQEGHWAKNCKGKGKMQREIPEDDDEDKEEFAAEDEEFLQELTLEKAACMAAGVPMEDNDSASSLVVLPHQLPRPAYVPPPAPDAIEPLFETVDGKVQETPKDVYTALGQLGFSSFRSGQEEAIMRILSGVSSLVVLSTGAGKSLCYQLPAYMYNKRFPCLSLVISPLVSLMEDQIGGLPFGLKGACLHTNQTKPQRDKIIDNIVSGKVAVLLLSPEALVGSGSGGGCLPSNTRLPPIAFACIDEAHCLSEWSHNFRPSYLRVCKVLRERFGVRCFLGLTATATRATAASVAQHLGISNDEGAVIRGAAVPPNLCLSVSRDRDRDKALVELLQGPRFSQCESIIIYCTRREVTERVATLIRTCLQHMTPTILTSKEDEESDEQITKKSKKRKKKPAQRSPLTWEAESYHAGMTAAQRRRVQKRFMSGELRIVVATVAFGMGLDKSNVRAIIHYNMPKSFEGYVQEIGRAGRDGLPSHCHVFLDREGQDMQELKRHIHANTVDRVVVKKLVNKLFPRCQCIKLHQQQEERLRQHHRSSNCIEDDNEMNNDAEDFISDEMLTQMSEEQMISDSHENDKIERMISGEFEENSKDTISGPLKNDSLEHRLDGEQVIGDEDSKEKKQVITSDSINRQASDQIEKVVVPSDTQKDATKLKDVKDHTTNLETLENSELEREGDIKHIDGEHPSECASSTLRICGGHDVAIPIESAVQELDMPEESIATLLCYLELHSNRWLEVLHPLKATCSVKFYGGRAHLRAVAKRIPPIAAALFHCEQNERRIKKQSSLVFPVVEIADKMGWDLDPVYKELRALQWNSSLAPESKMRSTGQSGILVEFTDNALHVRAPGDLKDDERDAVCDFVNDRIQAEERTQLKQLEMLYSSLRKVSCSEYWQCSVEVDPENDKELKTFIRAYFEDKNNAKQKELETLQKERENNDTCVTGTLHDEHVNWDGISRDIRNLTNIHHDQSFTGRAVARIFHGISSPCYPAEVWGRDRRFWRKHLDVDFNSLRKYATRELLKLR